MRRPRLVAFGVAALVVVLVLAFAHRAIVSFALSRSLSAVTGTQFRFDDVHLGRSHATFEGLNVATSGGEPLLSARHVAVTYDLRDLFPGGKRLYGLAALALDGPVMTLVRRRDGSFNLADVLPRASAPSAAPAQPPLRLDVRVRDGAIRLVDAAPREPDLALQTIVHVDASAHLDQRARSVVRADAAMIARLVSGGAAASYPIAVRSTTDVRAGFSVTRARAGRIPLRGLLNFLIHSPAARFDAGTVEHVDVVAYTLALGGNEPFALRLGGGADLAGAHIAVAALDRPIEGLGGHLDLFDDGVTTRRLDGRVAGIPLVVRGGVYDFANLQFRLGIGGDAELAQLKTLFAFLARQPVRGRMHLETVVTAGVADPLIRTALSAPRAWYGDIPLDRLHGIVDYERGGVTFTGVHAAVGPLRAVLSGNVDVRRPDAVIEAFVDAGGPAAEIPYAQAVAADAAIDAQAIVNGTGREGFRIGGTIAARGPGTRGSGFVAVDERGRGEFGPFAFDHRDGTTLAGALRLDRAANASAAWLDARDYRLDIPRRLATLPGIRIPPFPAVGGRIDARIVAGGPPSDFVVAGHVRARRAGFERYSVGTADLGLAGTLADLRLQDVRVDGPIGRFRGEGAVHGGRFVLGGRYAGSLEALTPFTGRIAARGPIAAPVLALVDGRGVTVQTGGAAMRGATILGFPIDGAAGTLRVGGDGLHIIAADADVRGAHAVAASTDGTVALSAANLPAGALAAAGVPLASGRVSLFGRADSRRPAFSGSVDLIDGVARGGTPIGGWADLAVAGTTLTVRDGVGALGATYARLGGRLERIDIPEPRYDLTARVPLGDIASLVADTHLPLRYAEGSFAARLAVRGSGGAPRISGWAEAPEGAYNGLDFAAGSGRLGLTTAPLGLRLDAGRVRFHASTVHFATALDADGSLALHVVGDTLNLADFDGYFDQSGELDGTGSVAIDLTGTPRGVRSAGRIALAGTRLGRFPLGSVRASWAMAGPRVAATFATSGGDGDLGAAGTLTPSGGSPLEALLAARWNADVYARGLRLDTWLPAVGVTFPVLGRLAASGHVQGVFPRLAIGGSASVAGGQIGGFPVATATVRTHVLGERVGIDDALLDLGFMRFTSSGVVGVDPTDPLNLHVHASVPDVAEAARRLVRAAPDVDGALEADALIAGTYAKPHITVGADLENGRYGAFTVRHVIGNVESDLRAVRLDSIEIAFDRGTATVAGSIPLAFNPPRIGPPSAPLSLTAEAHNVDLAPLAPLVPGSGTKLAGTVDGRLALAGTVHSPRVFGSATLTDGGYVSAVETSPIKHMNATVAFAGTSVALQALHANVGNGTLEASGQLELPLADAPPTGYSIDLVAKGAQLALPGYGGGSLDATAKIVSGLRRPTLSGTATIYDTTIPFATIFRATGGGEGEAGPPFDLGLDLRAVAGKNVRIRSPIIDVGATGEVALTGTLLNPRAAGVLTASRGGIFSTYQRLFRISDATVTFDPAQGIVPNLDLHATAHVTNPDPDTTRNAIGSADIDVAVTGPADSYTVSYSSEPAYTQAQIVALLAAIPFVGTVNFDQPQAIGTLRGAPGESNVLLPPGVTPYQTGAYTFQQEAFSLLNTQLTQRLLSPLENTFGGALGLTDLQLTIDIGGRVGYTARKAISSKRPLAISLGQVLSYPVRTQVGLTARPDATTSAVFSYFQQSGTPSYQNSIFGNTSSVQVQNGIQPLSNRQGFSAVVTRSY